MNITRTDPEIIAILFFTFNIASRLKLDRFIALRKSIIGFQILIQSVWNFEAQFNGTVIFSVAATIASRFFADAAYIEVTIYSWYTDA